MSSSDSILREFFVEMLRTSGELVRELLRTRPEISLAGLRAEPASLEKTDAIAGHAPDALTLFRSSAGRPSLAVVIAVQFHIDAARPAQWERYVEAASRQYRCAVLLLVMAPEPHIARWVRGALATTGIGEGVRPSVITYGDIPRVVDAKEAQRLPELAVLSALAHPSVEGVLAATVGISEMPCECRALRTYEGLMAALPERLRQELGGEDCIPC